LLSSGVFPSLHGVAAPIWKDAENVVFDDKGARKSDGLLGLENLSARPTGFKSTVADNETRLFVGAGTKAYRYRSSDGLTDIGTFGSSGGTYQFVPWDTWALISNGVDPVELWKNTGTSAPITAPFTRANVIFKYLTQAFAAGTDNGGSYVEWCSVNDIEDWTPTLLNTAGNLRARELEGDIICAQPIGNSIGMYSRANGSIFTYVGGTVGFAFRKPIMGVSALSPYSVVPVGDRHYGIRQDGFFVSDLVSALPIDQPAVRRYMSRNIDWDRQTEIYGWPDWANGLVRWAVPKIGGGTETLGFQWSNGTWTKFNDSVLLGEQSGPFTNMMLGKSGRLLRNDIDSVDNDASAFVSFLRSRPFDFGSRNRYKRIQKISLDMEWTGTVNIKLAYTNHPNDTPAWTVTIPAANEIYPDQLSQQSETVFLSMEISSTVAGADWRLSGFEVFGEETSFVN